MEPNMTIEEIEAALAYIRETPVPEGDNSFWRDQQECFLFNLLETLKAKPS